MLHSQSRLPSVLLYTPRCYENGDVVDGRTLGDDVHHTKLHSELADILLEELAVEKGDTADCEMCYMRLVLVLLKYRSSRCDEVNLASDVLKTEACFCNLLADVSYKNP